jgi:NhaP-type Na+/H+ or K+/H+ antiporter
VLSPRRAPTRPPTCTPAPPPPPPFQNAFDPTFFLLCLLPPIIFNAGWTMKRRHFFRHAKGIMAFAFAGTMFATVLVAVVIFYGSEQGWYGDLKVSFAECLCFGSLISATDPVTTLAVFTELKVGGRWAQTVLRLVCSASSALPRLFYY